MCSKKIERYARRNEQRKRGQRKKASPAEIRRAIDGERQPEKTKQATPAQIKRAIENGNPKK